VAGYFTPTDKFRHAIVSTKEARVFEIFFNPLVGKGQSYFGTFPSIAGIGAFFSPDDNNQHILVGRTDGFIEEIFFKPNQIGFATPIVRIDGIIGLDAFYTDDDRFRHVIVATNSGAISEIFYGPTIGSHISTPPLATFANIVGIAAFYTPDDNFRHVIVATADGRLNEIFYHPSSGTGIAALVQIPDIVAISGFYTADDKIRHVLVVTKNGDVIEVFYHPSFGVRVAPPLKNIPGANGVAGFFTPDDGFRHGIVTSNSGDVSELFYSPAKGIGLTPAIGHFDPTPPQLIELGPDPKTITPAAVTGLKWDSTAGQFLRIAGTKQRLYAAAASSGIWRSTNGGPWEPLPGSPGPGQWVPPPDIAVDPASADHVVVGAFNGAWESRDAGKTWNLALDPRTLGCGSSFVNSVAFSPASTLFVGHQCGIARRQGNAPFTNTPVPRAVTAITASQTRMWARTTSDMLFSTDDGASWNGPFAFPSVGIRYNESDTLAAIDGFAYVVTGAFDPNSGCGRDNRILVFNETKRTFTEVTMKVPDQNGNPVQSCDGTGSGITGHKFVRSFVRRDNLPNTVGQKLQIFYCAGQEVHQANGIDANGLVTGWTWIMGTQGYSGRDPVHADPWDFLIDVQAGGATAWIIGDGGVYKYETPMPYQFSGSSWTPQLDGMRAHNAITFSLLQSTPISRSRMAYPTGHNQAWIRDSSWTVLQELQWDVVAAGGDVNWSIGESASPRFALLARNPDIVTFVQFGGSPDRKGVQLVNQKMGKDMSGNVVPLSTNIRPDGPLTIRFLPTPKSEGRPGGVDAVMVVDLPLTKPWDGTQNPILLPGTPLAADSKGQPVLIRNKTFDQLPDINVGMGKGWFVEIPSFPADAMGMFVAGSRTSPVYYAFTGGNQLFLWNGANWNLVLDGLAFNPTTNGIYGPVFPNPYDRKIIYAIRTDEIVVSTNGAASFARDVALTGLVRGINNGPATALTHMAFDYEDPANVVAGATTGVFRSGAPGKWTDLTRFLQLPRAPLSGVGIDGEFVYVAANGRSPLGIRGYKNA